jgi:hypothetical protein
MASCKYCGGEIEWYEDETADRWVPLEPGTDRRHNCFRGKGRRSEQQPDPYRRGYADGYAKAVREHAYDYARGYQAGHSKARDGGAVNLNLDNQLLEELIRLCHPDRHPRERFEAANRATAKLNAILDEQGRRQ